MGYSGISSKNIYEEANVSAVTADKYGENNE